MEDMKDFEKQFNEMKDALPPDLLFKALFVLLANHKDLAKTKNTALTLLTVFFLATFPILVVAVWAAVLRWLT